MSVVIETTVGDITIDLYTNERPRTCLNFLKLCKVKYYNFCLFHKIERSFIAQTGDPTGTGRGGESIFAQLYGDQAKYFDAETRPKLKHRKLGTVSMVNNGSDMNGSQFFITLGEDLTYLDDVHTVFGEVAEGFEVLVKLNDAICDNGGHPYQDIRITHTVILHDPYEDPAGLDVRASSPLPTKEILSSNYVGADEEIDDTKGRSIEEIEEEIKDKEAKARATILEMVGDIPDADVKPPENVLFVCKLNPVTTSEDLEIIFSRFGPILSCEVIKEKKTGESLQYAFIEFEREEDCENAYFKMDNVLIDDRRIHVDFSQSVAKMKFDERNKMRSKNLSGRDKLVIKSKASKQDNYEMVFESDEETLRAHVKDKKLKEQSLKHVGKSNSPQRHLPNRSHKHGARSRSPRQQTIIHSSRHRTRSRSGNRHSSSYSSNHRNRSSSPVKQSFNHSSKPSTVPAHSHKQSSEHSSKHRNRSPNSSVPYNQSPKRKTGSRSPKRQPSSRSSRQKNRSSSSQSRSPKRRTRSRSPKKQPTSHSSRQRSRSSSPHRPSHSSKHKVRSGNSQKHLSGHVSKRRSRSCSPPKHSSRHKSKSASPERLSSKSKRSSDSRDQHHKHRRSNSSSPEQREKSSRKEKKSHRYR